MVAPAVAQEPVYEIDGEWIEQPDVIARGNPVVADWRFNVNDGENPPSNDPVDNVTAEFTLENAFFDEIPDVCLTEGMEPPSSISEDGRTLTCNFGTVNMGTAIVVQTPVVADGATGDEIALTGTAPDGQTKELPRIPIRNPFVMDMHWGTNTNYESWNDTVDPTQPPRYVDVDLEWSLRLGQGSDPGPVNVTYRVRVTDRDGNPVGVGFHPEGTGTQDNRGASGCTSHDYGVADGHPFSTVPTNPRHSNFVEKCILTPVQGEPGVFDLTLQGINYDLMNVPTGDSAGNSLPPNWNYVAAGMVFFRVQTNEPGSIRLTMDPETYTSSTGQQTADPTGNNTTNKSYTRPGGWSSGWGRGWTGSGGTTWDDTYRVSAGTTVMAVANTTGGTHDAAANSMWGNCLVFDTAFVTYQGDLSDDRWTSQIRGYDAVGGDRAGPLNNPPQIEYYTGGVGNPNNFDCGTGSWSTAEPADLSTVTAIRIRHPHSLYAAEGRDGIQLLAWVKINEDVPVGQDVWTFGSALWNGDWRGEDQDRRPITDTDDARYPHTNGRRDIVRIITAQPHIEKAAAQSTVTPGVPAEFTLTYSATGSGIIPDSVDDYEIVDTLPVGMTYVDGSADPAPALSMSGGQQVLTWTLDGVATNEEHTLTYQAVANPSVEPGTPLTNVAESSYGGETTNPVEETVTTTTNGYTTILKTSDVEYIPNPEGDGVGQGSWTVTVESFDPQSQSFTDTIDILPYNGDGRGTSFSGTYTLDDVVLPVPDGATVYYTDRDPSTLVDDPADESNGAAGDPTDNTVGWTTDRPENPTAVRVIGPELPSGGEFSFQVVITTHGAEPQDIYVNRAQGRAEHTELVMRTSAALTVTDYLVEKTSDPKSGSTVEPGDTVTYTVTVTQQGDVPAGATFTDDLSDVFDDATYNNDVKASIGEGTVEGDTLSWDGEIAVGEKATITYSVTVNDSDTPDQIHLKNVVTSPGCVTPAKCTTEHTGPELELPDTGANTAALVALAAMLAVAGLASVTVARRRA